MQVVLGPGSRPQLMDEFLISILVAYLVEATYAARRCTPIKHNLDPNGQL